MKDKIMFIIFPGNMTTSKHFKLDYLTSKQKPQPDNKDEITNNNSNFIPELKKLGKVHFVEPTWNNLPYYSEWAINNKERYLYNKNIDFTIEDLNIKKYCDKVYDEVKDFKGKFVLIGHSIGAIWVHYFSQKYHSRIIHNFILDGSKMSPENLKLRRKGQINYLKKYFKTKNIKDIKNSEINELLKKVKNIDNDSFMKLMTFIFSVIFLNFPENVKKLKVKTLQFRNLYIESTEGFYNKRADTKEKMKEIIDEEEYFSTHNPNKYKTIYFVNKSHYPHAHKESREIILNNIKYHINLKN